MKDKIKKYKAIKIFTFKQSVLNETRKFAQVKQFPQHLNFCSKLQNK